jgi:hypothetical protein
LNRLLGFRFIDSSIDSVVYIGLSWHGVTVNGGDDWLVENCTAVRPIDFDRYIVNDTNIIRTKPRLNRNTDAYGTFRIVVAHSLINIPDISTTDVIVQDLVSTDGTGNATEAFLRNYYVNASHPNPLVGYRPLSGGPLWPETNKWIGGIWPDGSIGGVWVPNLDEDESDSNSPISTPMNAETPSQNNSPDVQTNSPSDSTSPSNLVASAAYKFDLCYITLLLIMHKKKLIVQYYITRKFIHKITLY